MSDFPHTKVFEALYYQDDVVITSHHAFVLTRKIEALWPKDDRIICPDNSAHDYKHMGKVNYYYCPDPSAHNLPQEAEPIMPAEFTLKDRRTGQQRVLIRRSMDQEKVKHIAWVKSQMPKAYEHMNDCLCSGITVVDTGAHTGYHIRIDRRTDDRRKSVE